MGDVGGNVGGDWLNAAIGLNKIIKGELRNQSVGNQLPVLLVPLDLETSNKLWRPVDWSTNREYKTSPKVWTHDSY